MKKKAVMIILTLCAAVAMTACGGKAGMAEMQDTTAAEESAEADAQAEAEAVAPTVDEDAVEAEQTGEDALENEESFEEIEIGADGSVNGQEFPMIDEAVRSQDKSDAYGVYSISCYDLDQYLDEEGYMQSDIASADNFYYEYTGRWAYPKITPCRFFGGLVLTSRTDFSSDYRSTDTETGNGLSFNICSGKDYYNSMKQGTGSDAEVSEMAFTIQTMDGSSDVMHEYREIMLLNDKDENGEALDALEEVIYGFDVYCFAVGNFTVTLQPDAGTKLTQEDVQLIADNIRLTNGMER